MCELGEIKFDTMEINTDLAKEYFKKNNNQFKSITNYDLGSGVEKFDGNNLISVLNEASITQYRNSLLKKGLHEGYVDKQKVHDKLTYLAELVEENAEVFCQIEYAVRKIPVEEVKAYDIKLIVNNLLNRNHITESTRARDHHVGVMMHADTPLANIGYLARVLMWATGALVYSTKETAAVSHLFVELCREAGLQVQLLLCDSASITTSFKDPCYDMTKDADLMRGCIGVVTERSDLDSAVDVFLGTTTKYPWKLTRVLVQESIYVRFRRALALRTRGCCSAPAAQSAEGAAQNPNLGNFTQLADDVCEAQGKVFLVDYAGDLTTAGADNVHVEAYRTTKELITLLTKYQPYYLSLWSSDLPEVNEIAHKTQASDVWVNSYGMFNGPPQSSEAIYTFRHRLDPLVVKLPKNWAAKQAEWSAKSFAERQRIVLASIKKVAPKDPLVSALRDVANDGFVHVTGDHMCMGLPRPYESQYVIENVTLSCCALVAKLLTSGGGFIFRGLDYTFLDDLDDIIPFYRFECEAGEGTLIKYIGDFVNQTKLIWTNCGTIFAN